MRRSLRNTRRLLTIALTLAREDALFILDDIGLSPVVSMLASLVRRPSKGLREGQRLAAAFERLGPTFIKLGQTLSTRSDLIGEQVAEDLAGLRDRLPPFPTDVARAIIESQLEAPVARLFSRFDDTPVAAASIAQVHRALTVDGRDVAVKILRPGIEEAFARDLDLFFWIAEIAERRVAGSRRLKPLKVVQTFKESVFFELDLRFEAAAATELGRNMERHGPGFRIPEVDWNLTSSRVLTTGWVEGIPLSDIAAIRAAGFDTDDILSKASRGLFNQVFKDGFFHADLHPGNLFVGRDGEIVAVDFGIMGRLDIKSRIYIAEILRGFIDEDYRHVAEVHFAAGYVPETKSLEAFTQACMAVAKPITGKPLNEISVAKLLGQMFRIAAEFEMETQPQLLLLQKTMMVTEGVGRMLNPGLNTWQVAAPLIEEWATEQFSPLGKARAASIQVLNAMRRLSDSLRHTDRLLANLGDAEGIRLHSSTIAALKVHRRRHGDAWLGFIGIVLLFLILK